MRNSLGAPSSLIDRLLRLLGCLMVNVLPPWVRKNHIGAPQLDLGSTLLPKSERIPEHEYLRSGRGYVGDPVLGVALGRVYRCLKERGAWRNQSEAAKVRHARAKVRRELEGPAVEAPKREPTPLPAELAERVVERYLAGDTGEAIAP